MAGGWFTARQQKPARDTTAAPRRKWLATISRGPAVHPHSDTDPNPVETASRARNRAGMVTSLLVHDRGRLTQWLIGPVEGLRRVWRSIRQDSSRTHIALVGDAPTPLRHPTSLTLAGNDSHYTTGPTPIGLKSVRPTLTAVIDETVIPRLIAAHPGAWLAPHPRAAELASLLVAKEAAAAFALIDLLRRDADSIESLCAELFEPAARTMGDLWRNDDCTEFDVTLGLGRLQLALHRCSAGEAGWAQPGSAGRSVLLAPSPHEPHMLGSAVAVELFWRAGWDVSCDFPVDVDALTRRVHDHWFDVLDLSLSSAFTRDHRLEEMAATIRAARKSSINPALAVIVDGRLFHDHPLACAAVGADASCSCALELLPVVERQLNRSLLH